MQPNLWTAALFGFVLIAASACGGGGNSGRIMDLEERLAEAEQEAADAEAERLAAEEEARQAEQEAADAEAERLAAEEEARQAEQEAADAEAERLRLEQEAEKAQQEAIRAEARTALAGLAAASVGTVSNVMPDFGSTTALTTTPALNLKPSRASSLSGWSGTALSSNTNSNKDDLVVYTNIGPATQVGIQTVHTSFSTATGRDGFLMETIDADDAALIRSSAFPTTEDDPKTFSFNHDSDPANDASDDGNPATTTDGDGITTNDYDTYRVAGSYDGASGHFECITSCTVERLGNRYLVGSGGTWTFYARDTAKVSRDDQSWMYFGWWRREQKSDGALSFANFSGGVNSATTSTDTNNDFDDLTGSVTYRGPAVGQYAIYQPAGSDSGAGSFTARAELTANFGTNMLSGAVTNFSNASDWTLTLNEASMAGGNVEAADNGTVTWEIGDVTSQTTGAWIAEFFSESPYAGQTPDGVAGTFNAQFDDVGRLMGAFGAKK